MTDLTRIHLTLRVDERATLLSELVDEDCRTETDFETVRVAFVKAALDQENEVPCIVANEPDLRDRLPGAYAISEIDPRPTTADLAEAAGRRLVDGLVHCAKEPLRSADIDAYGRLPAASRVASAQRLIALELMSVWALRADGVRTAVSAGIR